MTMSGINQHTTTAAARRLFLAMMCALACALSAQTLLVAQDKQAKDARHYAQQAVKAYKEKNYQGFLENMKRAVSLRPTHQSYTYNLAVAYALTGDKKEALTWLARGAAMGLIYPLSDDADFNSIKETAEFKAILKKIESNKLPVTNSTTQFTIKEKGLIPESVAYDPDTQTFYVGSVYKRKILSVDGRGEVREFASAQGDGLWSVMGMKVDAGRRHLWVCTVAHPQMANYLEEDQGRSAIFKYDLRTGRLIKKYLLPNRPKAHWLGDLVLDSNGDVFATDSVSPAIYAIPRRKDELELFMESDEFVSPQGLALSRDEKQLFMADYSKGIFVVNLQTKSYLDLAPAPNSTLLGIDGLYQHEGRLIAIQNGVNPQRVVRHTLNRNGDAVERFDVLEANNPLFDEPTLGVVVEDMFYYVANSQWGAIDNKGQLAPAEKLREPVILKIKL
jgi:sugar lactone lactonase YvrE